MFPSRAGVKPACSIPPPQEYLLHLQPAAPSFDSHTSLFYTSVSICIPNVHFPTLSIAFPNDWTYDARSPPPQSRPGVLFEPRTPPCGMPSASQIYFGTHHPKKAWFRLGGSCAKACFDRCRRRLARRLPSPRPVGGDLSVHLRRVTLVPRGSG